MVQISPVVTANGKTKILVANKGMDGTKRQPDYTQWLSTHAHGQMCLAKLAFRLSQFNLLGCWLAAEICTYSLLPLFYLLF